MFKFVNFSRVGETLKMLFAAGCIQHVRDHLNFP